MSVRKKHYFENFMNFSIEIVER